MSGLTGAGVPMDEGQHLQSVFPPARAFGGPGRFAFNLRARLTDADAPEPDAVRRLLLREWGPYFDLTRSLFIEKSPPNLLRARYLQAVFPGARFIFIVRHPIPVSLATQKWSHNSIAELMLHWRMAHALMLKDLPHISRAMVLRYEDLIDDPEGMKETLRRLLDLGRLGSAESVENRSGIYFERWNALDTLERRLAGEALGVDRSPATAFGYALEAPFMHPAPSPIFVKPQERSATA